GARRHARAPARGAGAGLLRGDERRGRRRGARHLDARARRTAAPRATIHPRAPRQRRHSRRGPGRRHNHAGDEGTIMKLSRFLDMLATYGARTDRWPDPAAAQRLLVESPEARAALAQAARVDQALDRFAPRVDDAALARLRGTLQ